MFSTWLPFSKSRKVKEEVFAHLTSTGLSLAGESRDVQILLVKVALVIGAKAASDQFAAIVQQAGQTDSPEKRAAFVKRQMEAKAAFWGWEP